MSIHKTIGQAAVALGLVLHAVASHADAALPLQRHAAGTMYLRAAIPGWGPVDFLLDTGSSHVLISRNLLEASGLASTLKPHGELQGRLANGQIQHLALYRLPSLQLSEQCVLHDVEIAVLPDAARPILGMNILNRLAPLTISMDPPRLTLGHCDSPDASRTAAQTPRPLAAFEAPAGR